MASKLNKPVVTNYTRYHNTMSTSFTKLDMSYMSQLIVPSYEIHNSHISSYELSFVPSYEIHNSHMSSCELSFVIS